MSDNQEQESQGQQNYYTPNPYYYYPQNSQAFYPTYQRQQMPAQQQQQQQYPPFSGGNEQSMLPLEQSFVENILRLNRGKLANVYMTFENNEQKLFKGVIEAAGRDHIILSDPNTGKRYLLLMVYLDYVSFDEEINYNYPYGNNQQPVTYSPR